MTTEIARGDLHRAGGSPTGDQADLPRPAAQGPSTLNHGVETGIIRQLPNGDFIELERPLTEGEVEEIAALPPSPPPPSRPARSTTTGCPSPPAGRARGKLQARVHEIFVEGISLAPPADGHGNGHGSGNGHAAIGDEGERAAVGGGTPQAEDGDATEDSK